jgi:GT2 family glycosyltransferase
MHLEPRIAVVVPVHNKLALTVRFIKSFERVRYPHYTLLIVDAGSTDDTAQTLDRDHPSVVRLHRNGDLWWSGGTNLGVRWALAERFDYVLTINNDTLVHPDFLSHLVETAVAHPRTIVGARINFLDEPGKIWSVGGYVNWRDGVVLQLRDHGGREDETLARRANPCTAEILTGCGTLVPAACYREIGLYDERWCPQYHADSEFILRAGRRGWKPLVDLRAVVWNDVQSTCWSQRLFSRRSPWFWRPVLAIHWRYCPKRYLLRSLWGYYKPMFENGGPAWFRGGRSRWAALVTAQPPSSSRLVSVRENVSR